LGHRGLGKMDNIFLETTIQIDRNFTHKQIQIDKILKNKTLYSSTYVLGEYKSNILKDAIAFYNLLEQSDSTKEALSRLSEVLYSTRQYDRVIKIFSCLVEDGNMSKKDVKKRLSFLIEDIIINRFMRGLKKDLINTTRCMRANAYPEKIDGMWKLQYISCRQKPKPNCEVVEFIKENSQCLEKICELKQKNLSELIITLEKCLSLKALPYGRNCSRIGDAIISCEVPKKCMIYTTNKKDYSPICKVLGRLLFEDTELTMI